MLVGLMNTPLLLAMLRPLASECPQLGGPTGLTWEEVHPHYRIAPGSSAGLVLVVWTVVLQHCACFPLVGQWMETDLIWTVWIQGEKF